MNFVSSSLASLVWHSSIPPLKFYLESQWNQWGYKTSPRWSPIHQKGK